MTEAHVSIKATLPVCLHLDERIFLFPYKNGSNIEIKTENYFSGQKTHLGTGTNVERESDSFSHFRFTRIEIKIPHPPDELLEPKDILEKYKRPFFTMVRTKSGGNRAVSAEFIITGLIFYPRLVEC